MRVHILRTSGQKDRSVKVEPSSGNEVVPCRVDLIPSGIAMWARDRHVPQFVFVVDADFGVAPSVPFAEWCKRVPELNPLRFGDQFDHAMMSAFGKFSMK